MNGNKILIIVLALLVISILAFATVFFLSGGGRAFVREVALQEDVKTVIIPINGSFQTNLKGSKSIISVNYQIEVIDDKKFLAIMNERDPEARSKVLDILRDKTNEDVNGTRGKKELEQQILQCYRSMFGQAKIINIYIDDIVTQ